MGAVAITTPSRYTSTLAEVAPLQARRAVFIPPTLLPEALSVIGPGVGVGVDVAVGVGVAVAVGVGVGLRLGVGVGVAVAVGVGVGVTVGVGVAAAEPSSALASGRCSNSGEEAPKDGLV